MKILGDSALPSGSTANISAGGVYLLVDESLEVGSSIEFELTIPGESIGSSENVRLQCEGSVVRCEASDEPGRTGVACMIDRYEFIRASAAEGE